MRREGHEHRGIDHCWRVAARTGGGAAPWADVKLICHCGATAHGCEHRTTGELAVYA